MTNASGGRAKTTQAGSEGYYPIRTVAQMTGVNPITLRAWERRYGLIVPTRTASGHRLYSEQDISKINRILSLLSKGISIGQVARQIDQKQDQQVAHTDIEQEWDKYREQMLNSIIAFDEEGLDQVYTEALAMYPIETVTQNILTPLLKSVGDRWERTEGTVAEEHFFSVYLRNKLGARFHHRRRTSRGPLLLLACLPEEEHELGLLFFALAAHQNGYRIVLLGANLPLEEIPTAAQKTACDAVVLSSTYGTSVETFTKTLKRILTKMEVPLFIGGRNSEAVSDSIARLGAHPLGADINTGLSKIDATI